MVRLEHFSSAVFCDLLQILIAGEDPFEKIGQLFQAAV
ncbi:hypothetical protein CBM2605_A170306 [Cupriavidus neocaledonicus]|uniref:Transposase n=1 Tax=Cupriavidus neocaledonicus TaxID=1040979 RepID=A0ABY1UYA5_9BURK|nr:hypothetical protein CBM2605_A170306 [Cupriavidus neocaledonicus]